MDRLGIKLGNSFIEALAVGPRQHPRRIVVAPSSTTPAAGAAYAIAMMAHRLSAVTSTHFVVDSKDSYMCVQPSKACVGYDKFPNSVVILVCDEASGDFDRWQDSSHTSLVSNTATLVRDLCSVYKLQNRIILARTKRSNRILIHDRLLRSGWPNETFQELIKQRE